MKRVAVCCNSNVAFFHSYFPSLFNEASSGELIFLGNRAFVEKGAPSQFLTTSYTQSSFIDIRFLLDFFRSFYAIWVLKKNRVEYLHFVSAHLSNLPLGLLAALIGIKLVFTIHDLEPHPGKKAYFVSIYNKAVVILASKVVVHNKEYQSKLDSIDAYYIPLSGYPKNFKKRDFTKQLLFFGRIEEYKGIENLMLLGDYFFKNNLDYKIIIAGKGDIDTKGLPIPKNVEIINRFIEDEELEKLHSESSFAILPYNSASQSAVIIHSFALATPVIVYDVGSLAEYVEHGVTGYVLKHNDFDSLHRILINQEMNKSSYRSMQESVIKEFETRYDSHCFAKYSVDLYESLS